MNADSHQPEKKPNNTIIIIHKCSKKEGDSLFSSPEPWKQATGNMSR